MKNKYKVAEISIEVKDDNSLIYWIGYYGYRAEQGGLSFGYNEYGCESLEQALTLYQNRFKTDKEELLNLIKKKIKEKNK